MFQKITGGILYDDDFEHTLENWSKLCQEDDDIFYPEMFRRIYDAYKFHDINPIPNMIKVRNWYYFFPTFNVVLAPIVNEYFIAFCKEKNIDYLLPLL